MRVLRHSFAGVLLTGSLIGVTAPRLGLPPRPPSNQDAVRLGKAIFSSQAASLDRTVSCASCHDPQQAFSDGRRVSAGVAGLLGTRNAPSLKNAAFSAPLMWDGRRTSLEDQVLHPYTTQVEHGLSSAAEAARRLNTDAEVIRFSPGQPLTPEKMRSALAAYVRSLEGGNSAFDYFAFANQSDALTMSQIKGLNLFKQVGCNSCHQIGRETATFTDGQFHSSSQIASLTGEEVQVLLAKADMIPPDRLDNAITTDADLAQLGRYLVTHDPKDTGAIKTPSLRDVAQTAPYFHDGSVATLDAAVRHELSYRSEQAGQPMVLDDQEIRDIVSFIEALDSR